MIKAKKLEKINNALLEWDGANAEINSFIDSMSNCLVIALYKNSAQIGLRLGACQRIRMNVYLNDISFYCEKTTFNDRDCFLLKDRNSDMEIVVGNALSIGDVVVTDGD